MKYFYDDLFNNSNSSSNSNSHMNHHVNMNPVQRDRMMEQNITYTIMSALANYSVFYYSHVDVDDYKELVINQRERVLQIVTQFLKSDIFKENAAKYLNDFAGVNLIIFFKEFFNMVPSKSDNKPHA
jgi:F0F1-type ATP synthase membrane subunit a